MFTYVIIYIHFIFNRIGYSIAQRLGQDGAKVMISSRKQKNVDASLQKLKSMGIEASGIVCHVAKKDDRQKMIQKVMLCLLIITYTF